MENTQIELVKVQAHKALETVQQLSITNPEEYTNAVEVGGKLKKVAKMITDRKEEITKPLNEALKSARALFKPFEEMLEQAEADLKSKMLSFKEAERKEQAEAEKKAMDEARRAEELMKANKIDKAEQEEIVQNAFDVWKETENNITAKTSRTETGAKATEKTIKEYVIVDKSKIPLQFMEPDMVRIKASFKAGTPVEGVEEREKSIISF
jgi:hypothetical protein